MARIGCPGAGVDAGKGISRGREERKKLRLQREREQEQRKLIEAVPKLNFQGRVAVVENIQIGTDAHKGLNVLCQREGWDLRWCSSYQGKKDVYLVSRPHRSERKAA